MKRWPNTLLILAGLTAWCGGAAAQDYPAKPVRMMVGFAAGGAPDIVGRLLAQRLSESLGQQFVVENRPSAGGITATQAVAKAAPDGYTLLVTDISQVAIAPFVFPSVPYDPVKDFAPISMAVITPLFYAVQPSLGINTFQDLIAYAKANPGKLNYGSAGIGSIHHLSMEAIKSSLGLNIVHVPYKGGGQSTPAFLAGEVSLLASALSALGPHAKAGKAKLLAIGTPQRFSIAPDVPTVAEFVPGFDFSSEIGLTAPAGTPPAIVSRLSAEVNKALKHPDVLARLAAMGSEAVGTTPEGYADNIRRNLEKYSRAVKIAGAKVE
jgi:tripartite-type tricarboxylate transporter receptor subunit TctC